MSATAQTKNMCPCTACQRQKSPTHRPLLTEGGGLGGARAGGMAQCTNRSPASGESTGIDDGASREETQRGATTLGITNGCSMALRLVNPTRPELFWCNHV
jgi:hypothetical protein